MFQGSKEVTNDNNEKEPSYELAVVLNKKENNKRNKLNNKAKVARENKKIEKEVSVTVCAMQSCVIDLMNEENIIKKIEIEYYE